MPEGAFLPQEVIRRKRDGEALAPGEIDALVAGAVAGRVSGEQVAAFLMAAFLRGLDRAETVRLTEAMMRSGTKLDWSDLPGPVLDKLEAIPGYDTRPSPERLRAVVRDTGCAIVGPTADLAPADRLLYGIRDVTATVESIPLITASILSKKLAAGLQFLVMDVKTGSGAFMPTQAGARELARSLVDVATGANLPTSALITDMDQPLASAAGNAVELRNAVDYLTGRHRDPRLHAVVLALGGEILRLSGLVDTIGAGEARLQATLDDGRAAERFARMVAALGGPADILDAAERLLPVAPVIRPVPAGRAGIVASIDTRAIGLAVVALGGGRTKPADAVDPRVGFTGLLPLGAAVAAGEPLALLHAASADAADRAVAALQTAYGIGDAAPESRPPILERVQHS